MSALFLLSLLAFAISIPPNMALASGGIDIIPRTCKHTPYYEECVSSLQSNPDGPKAKLKGLAVIALTVAHQNATITAERIQESIDGATDDDPFMQQVLNDCLENYMDAIDQMDESLAALSSAVAFEDINTRMSAAISDVEACKESFKEQPGSHGFGIGLSRLNGDLYMQCSNALAIVKLLLAKSP